MSDFEAAGPDPRAITSYIVDTFLGVDIVTAMAATFFSLDPDKHWPNFATIVTTDEHDMGAPSNLTVRAFEDLVGGVSDPDHAALDRFLPHPVYAKQLWISILNPTWAAFEAKVKPLLAEAHGRIARPRRGQGA